MLRVRSSMVEQGPFKPLVEGSNPSELTVLKNSDLLTGRCFLLSYSACGLRMVAA